MKEAAVQRGIGIGAEDGDTIFSHNLFLFCIGLSGQVTDGAGNDGDLMALLGQSTCQFMMAGPAGFVDGSKGLVDEQNVHILILHCSGSIL